MKRILTIAIALCSVPLSIFAQNNEPICTVANTSFRAGESITLNIYYNVIGLYVNAGTANFKTTAEILEGKTVYHVVGTGWSNSKYDWIFKVRDRYESYFDAKDMLPYKFVRNVNEGKYKKSQVAYFYHNDEKVETESSKTFKINKCTQDVISALYNVRSLDFNSYKTGDKIPFDMYLDEEVYHMYIRYLGKEKITTQYGTFNAIKFKPLLLKGTVFKGGEKMTAWVSDDANHIPLRIESPLSVGSIKVDMMSYSGLRYPLSSLIEKD
ncbi:DUF3108 domain-containing protein [Rhizosphaericola mali]|uniref:DUF3108 domain-containing protein n=1 Tax=Rhizosphaericola mali TaxID=2545455 RepID=A0A5P2GET0_9BACT|nr:DUF3108 domain-containing protein [Rhizosphaericola mali]QES90111.1 DUF3108 domain-containing protein [Rhizosphaericola mali]